MTDAAIRTNGSLKERVYVSLKESLILGRLRPGEFLQEKELARNFGVSKTPVREALSELVKDRLVHLLPRKGYQVAPIDPQEVLETLELRMILEDASVGLAARRISPEGLRTLEGLILPQPGADPHVQVESAQEVETYSRYNVLFHKQIAQASGNRLLARAVTDVLEALLRVFFISYSLPSLGRTSGDHSALVEALRLRDAVLARRIMERHLNATRERLLNAYWGARGEGEGHGPGIAERTS